MTPPVYSVLATARFRIKLKDGTFQEIRLICDSGSQVNLISDGALFQIEVESRSIRSNLVGIGDTPVHARSQVALSLWHHSKDQLIAETNFVVLDWLQQKQPQRSFSHCGFSGIDIIELADSRYYERDRVDGVVGAEFLSNQLLQGLRRNALGLTAQSSTFGWIVFGGPSSELEVDPLCAMNIVTSNQLYSQIKKLWEIEEITQPRQLSLEEQECEEMYENTVRYDGGRYVVTLLLKAEMILGESRTMARRRLYCLESRFKKTPSLKEAYVQFMNEYEQLGHMKKADELPPDTPHYYIPHHAVAIDRKFRVVFDASAKTSNGNSLNDMQYTGPRLQKDLFEIILNFRIGKFALTADICKMFRQVAVRPDQWNYQRILWRTSQEEPIKEYWLTVVTYGMASSPYNAIKTLIKCAQDNAAEFPRAAQVVQSDFYVDDLLSSVETVNEATALQKDIIQMLRRGGFELAKWRSNCEVIRNETEESKIVTDQDSTSVVGIVWNFIEDVFQFKVQDRTQPAIITKRVITSEAARVYDPQGYLTPVTIRAKLFIQELWRAKSDWDTPLAEEMQEKWRNFYKEIQLIDRIRIPRWLSTASGTQQQIHVYCDASERAYGAVVYVRVIADNAWDARLLCSRSRVSPVNIMTIPRLELCAIELGCKLLQKIREIPRLSIGEVFLWTDSTITLYWLRKPVKELKTFVANRVSRILNVIECGQARHIQSEQNPADLLSRGMKTRALIDNVLWWNGPDVLRGCNESWPAWEPMVELKENEPELSNNVNAEVRRTDRTAHHILLTTVNENGEGIDLMRRCSSHRRVCRITAYVLRFCARLRGLSRKAKEVNINLAIYTHSSWETMSSETITIEGKSYKIPWPSVLEQENALNYWIRMAQRDSFPNECELIANRKNVSRNSILWTLTPQLDNNGLLRIYGRLGNTSLSDARKHPIILHRQCLLARRLAEESHRVLCHGGVQLCTQYLRFKYWIIGIRVLLRNVVYRCVRCARYRQEANKQFMADLPAMRLQTVPAFQHTGVDYAGPILLKHSRNTTTKGYIAVFVCMVYKAVHLELVSDLTAEAFVAALIRFVNLRAGSVRHMYSDNGTNFIKADTQLREATQLWQTHEVMEHLLNQSIEWHFNVPSAPHHGGLWEAAVKSTKYHLKRMGGAHLFTYEEMCTLLSKIAACLNSRPLTPMSTDPNDMATLTPGHFLVGQPIVTPYEPYVQDRPINRLRAFQRIQELQREFWARYKREYITEQQCRNKWAGSYRSLKVGDMVFIKNETTPPSQWLMGRIIEVFPGLDGNTRSCRVKTERSQFVRPITRLCLLPMDVAED